MPSAASCTRAGHVGVEREHDLRGAVDHRDAQPALRRTPRPSPGRCSRRRRRPRSRPPRSSAARRRSRGVDRARRLDRLGARGSAAPSPRRPSRRRAGRTAHRRSPSSSRDRQPARREVDRDGPRSPSRTSIPRSRCSSRAAADEPAGVLDETRRRSTGCRTPSTTCSAPRSNATISRSGSRRRAMLAALIPAASPPMIASR